MAARNPLFILDCMVSPCIGDRTIRPGFGRRSVSCCRRSKTANNVRSGAERPRVWPKSRTRRLLARPAVQHLLRPRLDGEVVPDVHLEEVLVGVDRRQRLEDLT